MLTNIVAFFSPYYFHTFAFSRAVDDLSGMCVCLLQLLVEL